MRELALFQHLAEALAQLEVALVLCALDELPQLVLTGAALALLLLLVHGLGRRKGLLVSDIRTCWLSSSSTAEAPGHGMAYCMSNS